MPIASSECAQTKTQQLESAGISIRSAQDYEQLAAPSEDASPLRQDWPPRPRTSPRPRHSTNRETKPRSPKPFAQISSRPLVLFQAAAYLADADYRTKLDLRHWADGKEAVSPRLEEQQPEEQFSHNRPRIGLVGNTSPCSNSQVAQLQAHERALAIMAHYLTLCARAWVCVKSAPFAA